MMHGWLYNESSKNYTMWDELQHALILMVFGSFYKAKVLLY